MSNVDRHIVVNYTSDQEGQEIRHEDVVRPSNHGWCIQGGDETRRWKLKSRNTCPTYGSCQYCFKSGPVGKFCNECQQWETSQPGYVILRNGNRLLDSITIAEILNVGHETAMADRICKPIMQRIESFSVDRMTIAAEKSYVHIEDRVARAKLTCEATHKFYAMLDRL